MRWRLIKKHYARKNEGQIYCERLKSMVPTNGEYCRYVCKNPCIRARH